MPATWSVTRVARSVGGVAVVHVARVLAEVREQAAHDEARAVGLRAQRSLAVDALEQERAQREHRLGDRLALADVAGDVGRLHEVVHDRVDARRARRAEHRDGRLRQLGRRPARRRAARRRCRG